MSGDIQVRKRKGKNKKKELDGGNERPGRGSKSQNEAAAFAESSSEYSDVPTFEQTEDYFDSSVWNDSKKKQQHQSKASGSGCCAKVLFIFLVTFLLILAALIFIQLHPKEYSLLVNQSQDPSVEPAANRVHMKGSLDSNGPVKRSLDIESIEDQILREEEVEKVSFPKISPRAVDVEIPDYDPDEKTPVQEPPIVKETAYTLGEEQADTEGGEESTFIDEQLKTEDSTSKNEERNLQANLKKKEKATEIDESNVNLVDSEDKGKAKRKNRKAFRKVPPSSEEILAHQNTLDRAEMLMSAIGKMSPNHPLLDELRPHLDGATRDLKNLKLEGLESTTKHALVILEDLYVRLADAKEKGELTTDHSRFSEEELHPQAPIAESDGETVSDAASFPRDTVPQSSDSPIPTIDSSAEISTPSLLSSTPAFDSTKPAPDSVALAPDTARPAPDIATRGPDIATPDPDTATPGPDIATPVSNTATPGPDTPTSAPDTPTSAPDTPTSAPDTPTPAPDTLTPAPDTPTPAPKTSPRTTGSSSNSGAASSKESAPRELSASRGDVGLEDLTEADLASPVDSGDQLLKLREAEALRQQDPRAALQEFTAVVRQEPLSARAQLGRARCLDALALAERSNARLEQAIASFRSVLDIAEERPELVTTRLLRASTNTLIDKLRFRGHLPDCVRAQLRLLEIFPDDPGLRNQLGITYLLQGKPAAAQEVFTEVLKRWPHNGLAQVHLGFILKTTDDNNEDGARLMKDGIASEEPGTGDARFYFHLGDALHRLGRQQEARQVYEEAAAKGLILRPTQRSLYNVNRLSAKPVWSPEETTYESFFKALESNWETIRSEGQALIAAGFQPESENLRDKGKWGQLELYSRGRQNLSNCARAPKTCSIVRNFKPASGCRRGQVKFSLMEGGTHVWAHCGPTNCRLRAHLGLVIPKDPAPVLRVDDQYLKWKEGEILIFDDSFEHEVWHNGTEPRLVLIVDIWHPELTMEERATLPPV